MTTMRLFERMSDAELLEEVKRLARTERHVMADLIHALVEVDTRRLYLGEGCSSLFTYCTRVLRLSEHAAWGRIEAARAAREHPLILDLLRDGSITLTTVTLLKPHLTAGNHRAVLEAARHRTRRDVERMVAALRPQPDVPASIRRLPDVRTHAPGEQARATLAATSEGEGSLRTVPPSSGPVRDGLLALAVSAERDHPADARPQARVAKRPIVRPLAPERYQIQFTIPRETHDRLRHVQDLLRHAIPNGDLAAVFDRALTALQAQLERTKTAATDRPRPLREPKRRSRHIPAAVRRAVWARDGGCCAYVGSHGRCEETGHLEFHHRVPYADDGAASVENIELRCRLCRYRHKRHYAEWRIMPRSRGPASSGAGSMDLYAA
jgi:5-methylcytosine-specific restriction endonuclease McrA